MTSPSAYIRLPNGEVHVGVQTIRQCDCGLGDARRKTGRYVLTFELIAVASMRATDRWYLNF